jgi:hypothetical protein
MIDVGLTVGENVYKAVIVGIEQPLQKLWNQLSLRS